APTGQCARCGADLRVRALREDLTADGTTRLLCSACGRQALLAYGDARRAEALAARDLAAVLGRRQDQEPRPNQEGTEAA
ncbi:MAG: hypothetical protein M3336_04140, partial [Chloroflexota bacterium]|nr:hypothetical protein [Chloroflexota bacterium]